MTCPAGTAVASPVIVDTFFRVGFVQHITLVIPPGHRGLTGLRFTIAGGQTIPGTFGSWFIGNNQTYEMDVVDFPNSGAWECTVYNLDVFDHSWQVTYYVNDDAIYESGTPTVTLTSAPLLT